MTERMRICADGKVGIGRTDPLATLHIKPLANGWADSLLLEHHSGNTGWNIHPENNTENSLWFGYNSNTASSANADVKMVLEGTTGNVGIGTDSPASTLHLKRTSANQYLKIEQLTFICILELLVGI